MNIAFTETKKGLKTRYTIKNMRILQDNDFITESALQNIYKTLIWIP